ncbi:MarR family winged helix-turn-helix transcriptional regulator [Pedobacter insulae]|uniref:DNA-binding transcriptional regulator, MarR family n=1 Tax=Pedobacter insulae TaxID=414048 RepID=A0A1I2V025_9SPHI|nr:MarR family winged helix-turn-helix transcriptional regulator [Pedobacter insulae]SFG80566.1 DNA-binding transcriptional regulator, MarR family [Pedobacter insulae]
MKYSLIKDVIDLTDDFESFNNLSKSYTNDIVGFKEWIGTAFDHNSSLSELNWEGKENGRTAESVINTLIVQMNRYAKSYSKSAIHGSEFSGQEDFIYLITLKSFGEMTKTALIKKNVHDKPSGIKIIDRLLEKDWVAQHVSESDKRSKILSITEKGLQKLEEQMGKIRQASTIVTGNLNHFEKMQLIKLLQKLDDFHKPIYHESMDSANLLDLAFAKLT